MDYQFISVYHSLSNICTRNALNPSGTKFGELVVSRSFVGIIIKTGLIKMGSRRIIQRRAVLKNKLRR